MTKTRLHLGLAALLGSLALAIPLSHAEPTSPSAITVAATQTDQAEQTANELPDPSTWMSIREVYDRLEKDGYSDIQSIHRSVRGYMARALDKDKKPVYVRVHPTEGTINAYEPQRPRHKNYRGKGPQGKGGHHYHGKGPHHHGHGYQPHHQNRTDS